MKSGIYCTISFLLLTLLCACSKIDTDMPELNNNKVGFTISVTKDGKLVTSDRSGIMTKGSSVSGDSMTASLDDDTPFGLIGIDHINGNLLVDNQMVLADADGSRNIKFDNYYWGGASTVDFSAYYPYVDNISYGAGNATYSIPYAASEVDAGPLVSKTVQKAIDQLNMIPLEFQHITNDIGFKICDATTDPGLQGLIHLRKLTAVNVASAGVYVDTLGSSKGVWQKQGYYRKVVVFQGDAKLGVGSDNELFVGFDSLVPTITGSHRYYSVPDEIKIGKQYVEVVYDVESFKLQNGYVYPELKDQVAKYMIYGLLPGNVYEYGRQYTFHIGVDITPLYHEVTFDPAVAGWETKIYENNDIF